MALKITPIMGKKAADGTPLIAPRSASRSHQDALAALAKSTGTAMVSVRSEDELKAIRASIDEVHGSGPVHLRRHVKELLDEGQTEIVRLTRRVGRSEVPANEDHAVIRVEVGKILVLPDKIACWLLNPDSWGALFEELDPEEFEVPEPAQPKRLARRGPKAGAKDEPSA